MNMSYDSHNLTTPDIKWLGVRPSDLDAFNVPEQCRRAVQHARQGRGGEQTPAGATLFDLLVGWLTAASGLRGLVAWRSCTWGWWAGPRCKRHGKAGRPPVSLRRAGWT